MRHSVSWRDQRLYAYNDFMLVSDMHITGVVCSIEKRGKPRQAEAEE